MMNCCENCAHFEPEWCYCFRLGAHVPKDGKCDEHKTKERQHERTRQGN